MLVLDPPQLVDGASGFGVWLLGLILQKVSGRPLDQFAKEALFEPLGIKDWAWERFPNGDPYASTGLRLRPRDLAKLGQLVLDNGAWQGRQTVSADWIKQMTTRHSPHGMWFRVRARLWLPMVAGSVIDRSPRHRLGWQPRLGRPAPLCGAGTEPGRRRNRRRLWRLARRRALRSGEPRRRHGPEFICIARGAWRCTSVLSSMIKSHGQSLAGQVVTCSRDESAITDAIPCEVAGTAVEASNRSLRFTLP
jgi:Beta-lactamase